MIKKLDIFKETMERENKIRDTFPKGENYGVVDQHYNVIQEKINELIDQVNKLDNGGNK